MTIASEITKLNTNLTNSYTAVSDKGGTLPQAQNFDNLATAIDSIPSGGGSDRNIGEIVTSTIPLSDAGLHLLDGALIGGSGSYADFVTYISGLVSTYPDLFETEANWQTSVTNYGVCGKFVYDSVNNTVRLPKITGFIEGTTDVTALGDLIEAGLPNITATGQIGTRYDQGTPTISGAFVNLRHGGKGSDEPNTTGWLYDLDASKSNAIYGGSSTVQPQTIKVLYYIVIATSTKTDIQVDIDEIATDLNGKADTDLSNCTKPHIVETYVNGTSWYRVYSDGWCEQGGKYVGNLSGGASALISLIKSYIDASYNIQVSGIQRGSDWVHSSIGSGTITSNSFYIFSAGVGSGDSTTATYWKTCGYIS